tara:strand:+ start:34072 stop:34851 length:780 start_codon:yes stop_codon:yes gene_type:complete
MSKKKSILLVTLVVPVFAILAALVTYFFLIRSDTPAPVSIENTITQQKQVESTTKKDSNTSADNNSKTEIAVPSSQNSVTSENLVGSWIIDSESSSYVGYRVKEELVRVGTFTAVGRTEQVEGTLQFDGESINNVSIKADLRSLKSDNQYRDRALSRQAIETSKFPYAEFELIEKISITENPEESQIIEVNAKGILKLHGVSKEVEIPLSGKLESQLLYIVGALPIIFDDFDIAKPSSRSVLSIEDNGIMEISLVFIKK